MEVKKHLKIPFIHLGQGNLYFGFFFSVTVCEGQF